MSMPHDSIPDPAARSGVSPRPGDWPQREFLGLRFDLLDEAAALAWLDGRTADSPFAYVVTPNVDHMVQLSRAGQDVIDAYRGAELRLCDSRVLARLARWCGVSLPVVPGSDLTVALLDRLAAGDTVGIVGGSPDMGSKLQALYPHLRFRQHVPPMGLRSDAAARTEAARAASGQAARVTLLAVGSPQQELLAAEMRGGGAARGTALCIGASLDFITGTQVRAPRLVRKAGMEWAWRLASNPVRLWRRYLVDGPAIFRLVWRWRHRAR